MPNLLIVGETNNGKTALVDHFLAQHRAQLGGSGTPSSDCRRAGAALAR
jgi:hypothetical protein